MDVIAHRGARLLAVENTVEALRIAWEEGADAVEIDVQLSADHELVVFHDDTLARLAGSNSAISTTSWRQLKQLTLHDERGHRDVIAHFDDILETVAEAPGWFNIELKVDLTAAGFAERLAERVAQRLVELDSTEHIVVSSFSKAALSRFAHARPDVSVATLIHDADDWPWSSLSAVEASGYSAEIGAARALLGTCWHAVHAHGLLINETRLAAWRDAGLVVRPWVVNQPRDWARCAKAAVSGVFTDDPGGMRRFLETGT